MTGLRLRVTATGPLLRGRSLCLLRERLRLCDGRARGGAAAAAGAGGRGGLGRVRRAGGGVGGRGAVLWERRAGKRVDISFALRALVLAPSALFREDTVLVPFDTLPVRDRVISSRDARQAAENSPFEPTYLQRGSGLSGAGGPQQILRSRQKRQAMVGFFFAWGGCTGPLTSSTTLSRTPSESAADTDLSPGAVGGGGGRTARKGCFVENLVNRADAFAGLCGGGVGGLAVDAGTFVFFGRARAGAGGVRADAGSVGSASGEAGDSV